MADFDADAAKAAGYSDAEIAKITSGIAAAKAAGYSDEEIKAHLGGGGTKSPPTPTAIVAPAATLPAASPPAPGWSTSRVLSDLGHYPAMAAQAAASGVTGMLNFPGEAADLLNRYTAPVLPKVLTTPLNELPAYFRGEKTSTDTGDLPRLPEPNLGLIAQPKGPAEALASSAIAGGTAALTGGALANSIPVMSNLLGRKALPAVAGLLGRGGADAAAPSLALSGKEIAEELPRMLREATTRGALPGVAAEAASQNLDLDHLGPDGKRAAEMAIAATAAIASHHYLGADPVEGVAAKLGSSENSDHAGMVAQKATREWRDALPEKIEASKGVVPGPLTPEGDVVGDKLFGKVPVADTKVDMTGTLGTARALAAEGGVFKEFLQEFGADMPARAKALLTSIARTNEPITEYPPKVEKVPSGPLRNDTSPIMEGSRSDLVDKPVEKLGAPPAGLLSAPTESPIATTSAQAQTNPLQSKIVAPGVLGVPTEIAPSDVKLPTTTTRTGAVSETVDSGMSGKKQVGEHTPKSDTPETKNAITIRPGEPEYPSEFTQPEGTITGFRAPLRDAMELRSYIGGLIARGKMPKGSDAAHWSALYKGITEDLGNTMEQHGAKPEWDNYNSATTQLYTDAGKLAKFSNDPNDEKDTAKPGKAVAQVWNEMEKDSGDITMIRAHIPEAADAIAAGYLRSRPQGWSKLPPETQRALVPNLFDRLTLNASVTRKPSLAETAGRTKEPLVGGGGGFALGELLKPHDGAEGSTGLMSPAMWTALGIMTPDALRALGKVKENPRMLNIPAYGAAAGGAASGASSAPGSPLLGPK